MELIQYFRLFRRWVWLILLVAFVAGSLSFINNVTSPPRFRTSSTIVIGNFIENPNPTSQDISAGFNLVGTYQQLVTTYDVLNTVVEELGLPFSADVLEHLVNTNVINGTSLLVISVTYTDPVLAADIANEIALQVILQSPSNLTTDQQAQVDILNGEIDTQRNELTNLREQLQSIDLTLVDGNLVSDARDDLLEQRNLLVTQINDASSNIAQFTNTIASLQQRTNSVEIVESARIPTAPIGSSLVSAVLGSAIMGATLAFGGVLTYEYLNDTVRSADELTRALNVPVLGVISRFGKRSDEYNARLLVNIQSAVKIQEEYRTLRTNILYTLEGGKRAFVITSSAPQEGKSVTAANIATSIALSGLKVMLIDADMRRPRQHEIFGVNNDIGLSNLLTNRLDGTDIPQSDTLPFEKDDNQTAQKIWLHAAKETRVPNLWLVSSGFIPSNPSELLGSTRMQYWMDRFLKSKVIDVIIFDSPPVLAVSDSSIIAANLDLPVLLVVQAAKTRRSIVKRSKERITNINIDVAGAILNGVNLRDDDYYGYNYGYYYDSPDSAK